MRYIGAILNYLEVEEYEEEIPDLQYMPPEQIMIRILKLRKKK